MSTEEPFNAIGIREDMARRFGGHDEDHDMNVHPLACMYGPNCKRVREYDETWSTMVVGGLGVIESKIQDIANRTDDMDTSLKVDQSGMDLSQHSTVFFCDLCMRHSVVSYECYERTWGISKEFQTGGEYYLYIACTTHLLKTPAFLRTLDRESGDMVVKDPIRDVAMAALVIPDEVFEMGEEEPKKKGKSAKKRRLSDLETEVETTLLIPPSSEISPEIPMATMVYTTKDAEVEVPDMFNQSTTTIPPSPPKLPQEPPNEPPIKAYRPWDGIVRRAVPVAIPEVDANKSEKPKPPMAMGQMYSSFQPKPSQSSGSGSMGGSMGWGSRRV